MPGFAALCVQLRDTPPVSLSHRRAFCHARRGLPVRTIRGPPAKRLPSMATSEGGPSMATWPGARLRPVTPQDDSPNDPSSNANQITVDIETSPDDVDIHVGALYWTNTPHDSPAPGPYQFVMPANYDEEADEYEILTDLPEDIPTRKFQMEARHLRNNIARGWFELVARPMAVGSLIALAKQEDALYEGASDE